MIQYKWYSLLTIYAQHAFSPKKNTYCCIVVLCTIRIGYIRLISIQLRILLSVCLLICLSAYQSIRLVYKHWSIFHHNLSIISRYLQFRN